VTKAKVHLFNLGLAWQSFFTGFRNFLELFFAKWDKIKRFHPGSHLKLVFTEIWGEMELKKIVASYSFTSTT
jgi:hypothetical protein